MAHQHQRSWAERVLVERLVGGDEAALGELYDRYAGFVHGLALRTLADRQAAEDVTQEVFVALWEHPERIDPGRGTLRGFLGAMTHRRAVDVIRREEARRRREARAATDDDVPDMAEAVIRSDMGDKVRQALDRLPEAQRRALELAYFHGYTYRQVAEALDIPEGTAKSRMRLALARIARILRPEVSELWT
jgi:RNA polymerase sigma-70 factor (ECF subfamily)